MALTGCGSDTVEVDAHPPTAQRAACRGLVAHLPHEIAGLKRRDVSEPTYAAAWGSPAVVLRCGVPRTPKGYQKTAQCNVVDGVNWFIPPDQAADPSDDALATTLGRTPAVELRVPAAHRAKQGVLVDVSAAIRGSTKTSTSFCP